jgi:hypothetical protein
MFDFIQFGAGFVVGILACYLVVRNQVAKNEAVKAYFEEHRVKAQAVADALWDEVSAQKAKLAELVGRISKD